MYRSTNRSPDVKFNTSNYRAIKTVTNTAQNKQKQEKIQQAITETQQQINEKIAVLLERIDQIFKED